jgi:hypothetical protein
LHGGFSKEFFVWGERSFTPDDLRGPRRAGTERASDHPWDPGSGGITGALRKIGFKSFVKYGSEKMEITLPSCADKYPLPSTPLLGELPRARAKRGAERLTIAWRVDAVPIDAIGLADMLPIFADGDETSGDGRFLAPGIMAALDLCYIAECCSLAASLLERGRFLPDIRASQTEDGHRLYESVWRPILMGTDAERFRRLTNMVPDILRARLNGAPPSSGEAVTWNIFDSFMDGVIRHSWTRKLRGASAGPPPNGDITRALANGSPDAQNAAPKNTSQTELKRRGQIVSALNPHTLWIRSLGWLGDAEGLSQSLESIYQDVREWWSRYEWFAHAPFKLRLKLSEAAEPGAGPWRLEYALKYLNTGDDIPARTVWTYRERRSGEMWGYCMRRYLLLMLGRAGSIFRPVRDSLDLPAPTGCDLSTEEASRFLESHAALMTSMGASVAYPEWWRANSSKRLAIRGRFVPNAGSASEHVDLRAVFKWELALGESVLTDEEHWLVASGGPSLLRIRGEWTFIRPDHLSDVIRHINSLPTRLTAEEAMRLAARDPRIDGFTDAPELEAVYRTLMNGRAYEQLPPPKSMRGELRPYQRMGYSWLSFLSDLGLGACLADDMGLGKTIQTLALIQHHRDKGDVRPSLLICPTSVLENWRMELRRFFPKMPFYLHHGRERARGAKFASSAGRAAIVMSSYALLSRDFTLYNQVDWMGVILDEAQNIKNPDTRQARAARGIKSGWRVVLTGTPIENHAGDLWSIMEFLMPGALGGRREFTDIYVKPEARDPSIFDNLRRTVAPFILRRMKTDGDIVPDLPRKIETKVYCGLTREQAKLYSQIADNLSREITDAGGIRRRGMVLAGLTRMKQICDHPSLVAHDGDMACERSSKLERLMSLAEEMFEAGDSALVFTQYVEMGNILKYQLQERFGREALFLRGSMSRDARDEMIRRFQEGTGPRFFVLSLKAGGVGLNLTRANHVVMFDRWWNPAVEAQAIDRAYRIGQTRNVQVHVFCCRGTLEERIDELAESKKEIAERVVAKSGDRWITEMSDRELRRLISLSPSALES